ncbi:tankyrase-1 [Plakobranchus ocellatus]|uniref:Tankyrase-1 n=1 Tax=Plakobranchus ocellatus TaxID=259542 RepID=A0AAV4CS55_9GAST|nr:tankyrase-1 [Plakobranchus ocellatus]
MSAKDVSAVVTNIISAIDAERTDVICSALSEMKKNIHDPELLPKVLNGLHTEEGTLLHYATKHGKVDKVRALLAGGADPGIQNQEGQLPLDLATDQIKTVFNEELLKATAQSNLGRVCQLLAAGVDIHLTDSPEMLNTPLHWAVCHGNRDMVQCLCARGADLNVFNARGLTPLHEAVKRADASIVEELVNYGADLELQVSLGENVGQTAFDMAEGKESVMQVLRAPRHFLEPINAISHNTESKANLVRFDSVTSSENALVNGVNGDIDLQSPKVLSPSHTNHISYAARFEIPSPSSISGDDKLLLLWPAVQSIKQGGGKPFKVSGSLPIFISPQSVGAKSSEMAYLWNMRRHMFEELDLQLYLNLLTPLSTFESPHVVCYINKNLSMQPGAYRLTITPRQMKIVSGDLDSLNSAIFTVLQLLSLYKDGNSVVVPTLLIDDWPTMPHRGVLLDVSQGRIPTMVYLYTRFHSNLPPQWQCPYSSSEVLWIAEFCERRRMQLIPVVEVGPRVQFEDLSKLYSVFQDFLACFENADFVSAGPRLSSFILGQTEDDGLGMGDVHRYLPILSHQTLQLCGYPLHDLNTAVLQQLPPSLVFKEYAVKSDHDYSKFCTPLAELGMNYFVCPGTAAWNSLAGCPSAAISNIVSAATCSEGALGLVVCDWTGKGHLNHQPFSWPGIVTAAGLSWNNNTDINFVSSSLPALLNQHVFKDRAGVMGGIVLELGTAETFLVQRARRQPVDSFSDLPEEQGSILYRFLTHPDGVPLEFLSAEALQSVTRIIRKFMSSLTTADSQCLHGDVIKQELQLACELMLLACKIGKALVLSGRKPDSQAGYSAVNFGIAHLSVTNRTDLANRLLEYIKEFRQVWSLRSNPEHGLADSVQRLRSLVKVLLPEANHSQLLEAESDTPGH